MTLRCVLFAEKPLGEEVFKLIKSNNNFKIVAVITNSSLSNWWASNYIWNHCIVDSSLAIFDSSSRLSPEEISLISNLDYELVLSIQYRWKIDAQIYNQASFSANLHLSPLPYYKGFNPFFHAILDEVKEFGVTLHCITDNLDGGDIINQSLFEISNLETAYSLYLKSVDAGICLVNKYLESLVNGDLPLLKAQSHQGTFYKYSDLEIRRKSLELSLKHRELLKRALYFPPVNEFKGEICN